MKNEINAVLENMTTTAPIFFGGLFRISFIML